MNFFDVLGEELAKQVQAKIDSYNAAQTDKTKHVKFVDLSEGGYVGKEKFDRVSEQVKDLQDKITQRDTDMESLKTQLETAVADGSKLTEAQKTLATLQEQYANDKTSWETKIKDQAYEFRIRELAGGLQFSSNAAKNEFIREAVRKKFSMDGDKVLGFDDYLKGYKETDPGAFAQESGGAPQFVHPSGNTNPPGTGMNLAEAMKRANAGEKIDIGSIIKNNRKD